VIVSRRWLEALLNRPLEGRDVADRLARQVAPVDAVIPIHQDLHDVIVARVLEVKQHPNADRLSLCQVDAGSGTPLEVVCGAPNVQAGKSYPFAPVGATLPGGLKLDRRKIRRRVEQRSARPKSSASAWIIKGFLSSKPTRLQELPF
jgi:phenylalanyl-tRNA synthetase beta chain